MCNQEGEKINIKDEFVCAFVRVRERERGQTIVSSCIYNAAQSKAGFTSSVSSSAGFTSSVSSSLWFVELSSGLAEIGTEKRAFMAACSNFFPWTASSHKAER